MREKRELLGLSQRALGLLFEPAVTTQFISNIERGVTPLPPVHVATLVRVLRIPENELLQAMEKEYAAKISHRLGRAEPSSPPPPEDDQIYMRALYDAYRSADGSAKEAFHSAAESLLHVSKPPKAFPK